MIKLFVIGQRINNHVIYKFKSVKIIKVIIVGE